MKHLLLILTSISILSAQPMIYERLPESIERTSSLMRVSPPFDSGDLPANSGWMGTFDLFVKVSGDAVQEPVFYAYGITKTVNWAIAGMSMAFTFPEGSTLSTTTEYYRHDRGFYYLLTDSALYTYFMLFYLNGYNTGGMGWAWPWDPPRQWRRGAERDSSGLRKYATRNTFTVSPTDRQELRFFTDLNGGLAPWITWDGDGNLTMGDCPESSAGITNRYAHVRISFRIDVGETPGHLKLLWSCPVNQGTGGPYEIIEIEEFVIIIPGGSTNF
ncbi:MAG: hypothetical protein ABIH23_00515, partial [bacterium]